MHQVLRVPEILLNIFGHCFPSRLVPEEKNSSADLAVLARTCRTFKDPALDILWEELHNLSPLARCIPKACCLASPIEKPLSRFSLRAEPPCYMFSRPLKREEWDTLRGYTRRIRLIHGSLECLREETIRQIFSLAPFDDPLFPHLRLLNWNGTVTFAPLHAAVPSLTSLHFTSESPPYLSVKEFFDAFGDCCPQMANFVIDHYVPDPDSAISCAVCRWPKLREVVCPNVALNTDAIIHLSSLSTLNCLGFTPEIGLIQDISHHDQKLVFSSLTFLDVRCNLHLDTITSFLRCIRLPVIETLYATTGRYISRRSMHAYWVAVREACPADSLTSLEIRWPVQGQQIVPAVPFNEEALPFITLEDLRPRTAFAGLCSLHIDLNCPVSLADADLLELVSPRMECFLINYEWGWQIDMDGGGITLSGLVQLLQQRPKLDHLCLAIDTRTFMNIPSGLDASFHPRRQLKINVLDSYILPEFIQGLVSVFRTLGRGQGSSMLIDWEILGRWSPHGEQSRPLWECVLAMLDGLKSVS